jgi:hypothetical protein
MTHKKPIYDEYDPWATYNPGDAVMVRRNPKRNRKPNFVAMVKRAQRDGLNIKGVSITANGVVLTLGDTATDTVGPTINETAEDLRKLL